jgi:ParB/RepB/Spo0J family partition protein
MTTVAMPHIESTSIPLSKIRVKDNVRKELAGDDVDALAGSIELLGVLQPVLVAPLPTDEQADGFEFDLVAGYTRYAAFQKLGLETIPATTRDAGENAGADTAAARAAENIVRKQLNAYEEAVAVEAMLDRGVTEQGAAQALGWPQRRVAARVKILELPEKAQVMIGAGNLPLSYVDTLRAIGQTSSDVLDLILDFVEGDPAYIDYLRRDVAQLVMYAKRELASKVYVEPLTSIDSYEIDALRLPKSAIAQYEELCELHKKVSYYSYGNPSVRFGEPEVDQARAAGVLIEGVGSPLIVDKSLYRELVKQAIARTLEETNATADERAAQRKVEQQELKEQRAADPETELRRDHGRKMRSIAEQAHGANTDLGWALRNNLASVDPTNMDVARFFVYALLESGASYSNADADSDRVTRLESTGIRLVIDEFREDVTKTRKDGTKGALRIDYNGPNNTEAARAWLWKFIEGGKTAGDLYGRALVVIAAEHYASRLVVPSSQQHPPLAWGSRQGKASKALEKLAGPHVPVSLKQLQKAVAKAKTEYDRQLSDLRSAARNARAEEYGSEHVDKHPDEFDNELDGDAEDLEDLNDLED